MLWGLVNRGFPWSNHLLLINVRKARCGSNSPNIKTSGKNVEIPFKFYNYSPIKMHMKEIIETEN